MRDEMGAVDEKAEEEVEEEENAERESYSNNSKRAALDGR